MKKLLILALFVQGIYNASVFGMIQEIVLTEMYSVILLVNSENENTNKTPDPNRLYAFVNGNQLFIESDAREPIYVEVVSKKSGQVVATREFVGNTVIPISRAEAYTIRVYSGNFIYTGEFIIE